ncbi:ankyrin [Sporormia fimetaria CBS 119925]|uniref:Ankyrin n=1 Tax=Sporormia fimetaria CBS 119925 TaxID=1340428 RepID=A0A6A6VAM2_9PLEO|nr:ankyrin [Sporormia fimetaria CBS 119925]
MIEAIKSRIPRDVRHQIKAGKSVLACDEAGWNSLHLAVKVGSKRILMELLKAPEVKQNATRLNDGDQHGETPLHLAARLGRAELLLELLHAGANVDALDDYGRPPLERAITGNRDNVVEILLRYKADERLLEHEGKVDPAIKSRLSQMKRVKHMMKRH